MKQNADDSQIYELISNVTDLKIEYVMNSDIRQGNAKINWKSLEKELVNIKSDSTAELKISFKVAGQATNKIYILGQD